MSRKLYIVEASANRPDDNLISAATTVVVKERRKMACVCCYILSFFTGYIAGVLVSVSHLIH
jgi:hypothetical protein